MTASQRVAACGCNDSPTTVETVRKLININYAKMRVKGGKQIQEKVKYPAVSE